MRQRIKNASKNKECVKEQGTKVSTLVHNLFFCFLFFTQRKERCFFNKHAPISASNKNNAKNKAKKFDFESKFNRAFGKRVKRQNKNDCDRYDKNKLRAFAPKDELCV